MRIREQIKMSSVESLHKFIRDYGKRKMEDVQRSKQNSAHKEVGGK